MRKEEMIVLLQQDLQNEYLHWAFYMQAGMNIVSLHREEISEFFFKQAASEMQHIQEFGALLLGLGASPHPPNIKLEIATYEPQSLIEKAIDLENEVVENYHMRMKQAESMDSPEGSVIHVFMEEQIMHSWQDAKHMQLMSQQH